MSETNYSANPLHYDVSRETVTITLPNNYYTMLSLSHHITFHDEELRGIGHERQRGLKHPALKPLVAWNSFIKAQAGLSHHSL